MKNLIRKGSGKKPRRQVKSVKKTMSFSECNSTRWLPSERDYLHGTGHWEETNVSKLRNKIKMSGKNISDEIDLTLGVVKGITFSEEPFFRNTDKSLIFSIDKLMDDLLMGGKYTLKEWGGWKTYDILPPKDSKISLATLHIPWTHPDEPKNNLGASIPEAMTLNLYIKSKKNYKTILLLPIAKVDKRINFIYEHQDMVNKRESLDKAAGHIFILGQFDHKVPSITYHDSYLSIRTLVGGVKDYIDFYNKK